MQVSLARLSTKLMELLTLISFTLSIMIPFRYLMAITLLPGFDKIGVGVGIERMWSEKLKEKAGL
jgi:hypothetical protein